jgi:hypothetical protein
MARRYDPVAVDLFRIQNLHATCGSPSQFLLHMLKLTILELNGKSATENAFRERGSGSRLRDWQEKPTHPLLCMLSFAIASGCPNKDEFELAYLYLRRPFSSA